MIQQSIREHINKAFLVVDLLRWKHTWACKIYSPALLQEHNVSPAQFGQVVGYWCPHYTSSTDHHPGLAG